MEELNDSDRQTVAAISAAWEAGVIHGSSGRPVYQAAALPRGQHRGGGSPAGI
jgi:hypothetical protein